MSFLARSRTSEVVAAMHNAQSKIGSCPRQKSFFSVDSHGMRWCATLVLLRLCSARRCAKSVHVAMKLCGARHEFNGTLIASCKSLERRSFDWKATPKRRLQRQEVFDPCTSDQPIAARIVSLLDGDSLMLSIDRLAAFGRRTDGACLEKR
ncbi:hypothetical protein [Paraburkholderia sp. WSM4177]|uniref:hypothetical protein n=1 Tax=unclassified Paraburkholderia TaxID=2615204 RepID=UPI00183380B7|nr:hypothetical protein [Paraburkholderia sp. WSM4177]MBB5485221.1 hypothetical protein [Paraburkholderia sp. WSM4180]